jgi:hypothetical protein
MMADVECLVAVIETLEAKKQEMVKLHVYLKDVQKNPTEM